MLSQNNLYTILKIVFPYSLMLDELKTEFKQNFRDAVKKLAKKGSAVMFSGGVDSTTMAFVAKDYTNILLITIGTSESSDLAYADKISKEMNLRWKREVITEERLAHYVKKVKEILNDYLTRKKNRLMEIELGVTLLWCCELAKEEGITTIFNGQGAEELFGGYERHLIAFREDKRKAERLLVKELQDLPKTNLERNNVIIKYAGIDVVCPFLDERVVATAMKIPIEKKIDLEGNKKIIWHEMAKEMGVPKLAYERPKKAAQYGSGIHKMLIKMIKDRKITIN